MPAGLTGFWSSHLTLLEVPLMVKAEDMPGLGPCMEQCLVMLKESAQGPPPFPILLSRWAGSLPLTARFAFSFMKK